MGSTNTEGATRRADWQAFCAHGQAEAAAIKRRIESSLAPHERDESIWLLVERMP
jgi:hypothetical protein